MLKIIKTSRVQKTGNASLPRELHDCAEVVFLRNDDGDIIVRSNGDDWIIHRPAYSPIYPALALASGVMTIIIFLVNIAYGIPNDYIVYAVAVVYFICFSLWVIAEPKPLLIEGD